MAEIQPSDDSRPSGGRPFDSSGKLLIELAPNDWLKLAGLPGSTVGFENVNKVSSQVDLDRLLRVQHPNGSLYTAHFELQGSFDPADALRFWGYNVVSRVQSGVPVRTVIVLLRREASRRGRWDGILKLPGYDGLSEHIWRYDVIRVWELDPEMLMAGGVGTLPLAPLASVPKADVPALLNRIKTRLIQEVPGHEANDLWGITTTMLGLRFRRSEIQKMGSIMLDPIFRDSSVIQIVWDEAKEHFLRLGEEQGRRVGEEEGRRVGEEQGRRVGEEQGRRVGEEQGRRVGEEQGRHIGEEQGRRESLLELGTRRFGEPTVSIRRRLEETHDLNQLAAWLNRLLDATSWEILLQD